MTRYNLSEIAGELEPVEFEVPPDNKVFTAIGDPTQVVWDSLESFAKLKNNASAKESQAAVRGFLVAAFGEEQTVELMERLGLINLAALAGTLAGHYSEKAGKAQGSNRASQRATAPSKRTSNGSTGSTSNGRSTAGSKNVSAAPNSPG